jgi:hypothetical protein
MLHRAKNPAATAGKYGICADARRQQTRRWNKHAHLFQCAWSAQG